jgi:hypothetical protein
MVGLKIKKQKMKIKTSCILDVISRQGNYMLNKGMCYVLKENDFQ